MFKLLNQINSLFFPRSLHSLGFYKINLFNLLGRPWPLKYSPFFILTSAKVILFWWFFCDSFYHAYFDREFIDYYIRFFSRPYFSLLFVVLLLFPTFSQKCPPFSTLNCHDKNTGHFPCSLRPLELYE